MELEVEGKSPVGRPKKTWSKVMEEDMKKLNITEDSAEDRKQWRQSHASSGKLEMLNENDNDMENDFIIACSIPVHTVIFCCLHTHLLC
mgnify:FL=1